MSKYVYLAGPISGCSYNGCTEWRDGATAVLRQNGIIGLSPMRAKDYLAGLESISSDGKDYAHMSVLSLPRGVTTRDRYDTQRSNVVLMNLLGTTKVSIGSMIELGWADSARVPVVLVMEESGNVHEHMMVSEVIGYRVTTIQDAIHVCKSILTP